MIDRLLGGALTARLFTFIMAIAVLAGGWYAYQHLTIEAFPDPTDTQVQVITIYPGQPSEEVERRVSIPLERALNGVPGLFRLRSVSLFGLSAVTLTFDDGVEPLVARQQIMERIPDANLPPGKTWVHLSADDMKRLGIDLSAGMEELAGRYCRASAPRCEACPLKGLLPV